MEKKTLITYIAIGILGVAAATGTVLFLRARNLPIEQGIGLFIRPKAVAPSVGGAILPSVRDESGEAVESLKALLKGESPYTPYVPGATSATPPELEPFFPAVPDRGTAATSDTDKMKILFSNPPKKLP